MQERSAAALISRHGLHNCMTRILCFTVVVFMVAALSQARAGSFSDTILFTEVYELELEDGGSQRVTFESPRSDYSIKIDKDTSLEAVINKLNVVFGNFDYTVSYDAGSGQLILMDASNTRVDFKVLAGGEELTVKSPSGSSSGSSDGLSALLSAFDTVVILLDTVWTLMLSNPLMVLFLAASLLIIGVRAFRQVKRAAK